MSLVIIALIAYAGSNHNGDSSNTDPSPSSSQVSSGPAPEDGDSGPSSNLQFHGYDCTQDCSGHEAGYAWAEEHDITDEDDCGGNSESFIEGCKAYVQEQGDMDSTDDRDDDSDPDDK